MLRHLAAAFVTVSVVSPAALAAPSPVRLTAPLDGTVLVPGESAVIAWEPTAAWPADGRMDEPVEGRAGAQAAAPIEVEEWEAFLSVDGGRTYPYRITPHLDSDVATFHFPVPEVVSEDVRVLIRMGNERREVGFEMPEHLAIGRPGPLLALRRPGHAARHAATGRGEAARPGEAGVRAWVEGTRRGGNLRLRTASVPPSVSGRSIDAGSAHLLAFMAPRHEPVGAASADAARRRERVDRAGDPVVQGLAARAGSILLLIQRSNR
jgi:hypothetical protein